MQTNRPAHRGYIILPNLAVISPLVADIVLQKNAEQWAPIRQDSITAARGPIATPIRHDSIIAVRGTIVLHFLQNNIPQLADRLIRPSGRIVPLNKHDIITILRFINIIKFIKWI